MLSKHALAMSFVLVLALVPAAARAVHAADVPGPASLAFAELADAYIDDYLAAHPVRATRLGVHDHDGRLPDVSRNGLLARVEGLRAWLGRIDRVETAQLTDDARWDHAILRHAILAELLELEELQGWRRNPMLYNRWLSGGMASLVDRQFADLETRLTNLISRLEAAPGLFRAARKNLRDVPALWAEIGLRNTRGSLTFLGDSVPRALKAQGFERLDPALQRRWRQTHRRALRQLESFVRWLENDLQPRASGDFRLGRELFERKLLYDEHLDVSVDELQALNASAIEHYSAWVVREARRVDPDASAAEVMQAIVGNHPAPDGLIAAAGAYVEQARDLVRSKNLLTLPTDELPIVRPTPEYARSGFASMSTPGPFESRATEAYYNITNVDPDWTERQQNEHLTYFNRPGLLGISVHEAMPGHFVQLLYQRRLPTRVRKVFAPATLVEGWAHYAEQMMVDEGLGGGDPAIRLGQLRRALQRHARWHAGLALHAFGETIDAAAERFQQIAFFAPFPALRETQRATYDPTYLYYALGRMQIFELREDYRKHVESRGHTFSLREFHDRFLALGLPIPLARQAMLPD